MNYKIQYDVEIPESIPKLEAIEKLKGAIYTQTVPGAMVIQQSVKVQTLETPQETIDRIINDVSQRSGIEKEKILSRNRRKEIVAARFACMYLLRKEAFMTFAAIGRIFGRDHSTAMHALRTVENLLETNDYLMVKNTGVVPNVELAALG